MLQVVGCPLHIVNAAHGDSLKAQPYIVLGKDDLHNFIRHEVNSEELHFTRG